MPHIGAVMERSLGESSGARAGLMNLVVRSVVAGMGKRDAITDLQGQITDAKTAFSSWDNCMKATFCKWPVIAVIIIGGLIIFSVVWCIVRCACCGLSCCCECCYCLKCCGSCCGCCDSPKKTKYLDEPFVPPHHDQGQGYRSEAPMIARAIPKAEPPQYAEFETARKGTGDELPAMPSWEDANSKKVVLEEEPVELEQLKKPMSSPSAPLMAPGAMSHPPSPNLISPIQDNHSPYGAPSLNGSGAYVGTTSHTPTDPYTMNGQGQAHDIYGNAAYGQPSHDDVGQGYNNQGYNQGYGNQDYGAAGAMGAMGAMYQGQGRRQPPQDYNNNNNNNGGYGRGPQGYPQSRTPRPYDEFGRSGSPRVGPPRNGTPGNGGYGRPPPRLSPPQAADPYGNPDQRRSPAPQQRGYGYEQRSNTPNSYGRQAPPAPQRQYSSDSTRPLARVAPERQYSDMDYQESYSPIQNSGGFDFTGGSSRPNIGHANPAPQQGSGGSAYPGYRAYKPQQ